LVQATIDDGFYLELLEDWPLLIGRFICAFSGCEFWTYAYLQALGGQGVRDEFANKRLDLRIDKIKLLADERGIPAELRAELVDALGELKSLGHLRNLTGHNAPMAHVWWNEKTDETKVLIELRAANNDDEQATKVNLGKWFTRARTLEDRLAALAGKMSQAAKGGRT
jgi:hypothetical protein